MAIISQNVKSVLKKSEGKYMARIPQVELISAMSELSNGAYKLLMYYYSRNDGWRFVDKNIAKAIGSSERQVKKFRKELIDLEYLLIQRGSVDVYFIGKKAVDQFLAEVSPVTDEAPMDPLISPSSKTIEV